MYIPPAFRESDATAMHETMRAAPLASLITATAAGLLCTPLPLLLEPDEGGQGVLYGHLARANPHWREPARGDSLAIFSGPDAYVTPS